jgi:glutamate-1-semialdehyde 2,1-aminomutase
VNSATNRYIKSLKHLKLSEEFIPLGAQTVSKSRLTFIPGIAPIYGNRALGSKIWDIDGNEYVDLVNSLAAVTLGHADPEISEQVKGQIDSGTTISLTHPIELEVAKKINALVPCAEMVRFGKNGSDATSAAIRVARAFTGRDRVLVCGYHGWHDWYIGTTPRGLGVPKAVSELAESASYNDLQEIEIALSDRSIAALILEPMNSTWPIDGFLEGLRELCTKFGTLLIFDETITGFRYSNGGAQEYFNVIPDLATFGKGLANGYPLSAVTGKKEFMMLLEDVFFSGTFGGELLSLTAANVVLERISKTNVVEQLSQIGNQIDSAVNELIKLNLLTEKISLSGHPSWKFLLWNSNLGSQVDKLKALFMQEMSRNGVLMIATHNVSSAINNSDIDIITNAYSKTLPVLKTAIDAGSTEGLLEVNLVQTRVSVR